MAEQIKPWKKGPERTKAKLNEMVDWINDHESRLMNLKNYPANVFEGVVNGALCRFAIPSMLLEVLEG